MPIYTYQCESCGNVHDKIRKLSEQKEPLSCPKCGSPSEHKPFISGDKGSALKFKGKGWYCTNPDNYK